MLSSTASSAASSSTCYGPPRDLHPFPTRRSSDLTDLPRGVQSGLGQAVRILEGLTAWPRPLRSEEHTSELQSRGHLVCRLLLEKKKRRAGNHPQVRPLLHDLLHEPRC